MSLHQQNNNPTDFYQYVTFLHLMEDLFQIYDSTVTEILNKNHSLTHSYIYDPISLRLEGLYFIMSFYAESKCRSLTRSIGYQGAV